ncbi:MAG TPA: RNA polymerase sigma factor RpoH [Alphaproteobacteria bacterium]|nr:RNA polymerase sigma factor RpoH [Alphaproteobacteria bacterium]
MSAPIRNLPILKGEGNLAVYLREIKKFPMLEKDEEYILAKSWKEHADLDAAHKLVTSHLRLVAKIAMGYRGYGLPLADLIAEGNVGMMQAVKRFDPERGFRLATYAIWWIRASIQEYILHSWSLVKIGTTAAQKKLFFNLRRLKGEMKAIDDGDLSPEQVKDISERLSVPEEDVVNMNRRMLGGGDQSLNAPIRSDGEGDGEWQDWLEDKNESVETRFGAREEMDLRQRMLEKAMQGLNPRERDIIAARRLKENPATLEDLSQRFGISRERVRQIEVRAFEKLQKNMKIAAEKEGLLQVG